MCPALTSASETIKQHLGVLLPKSRAAEGDTGGVNREQFCKALIHAAGENNYDAVARVITVLTSHLDSLVEVRVKELRELFSKLRGFLNGLDQSKFRLTLRETSINEAQRQEKVIDFTYNHKGKKLSGSFVLESGTFEWRYALGGFSERTSIIKHLVFNNIVGAVDGVDDAFVGRCLDGQRLGRSPDCEPAPYLAVFAQHLDRRKYHGTLNYIEHCRDEAFEGFIKMMVPKAKALK